MKLSLKKLTILALMVFAVIVVSDGMPPPPANAGHGVATYTVTNTGDAGGTACNSNCSLRQAINAANTHANVGGPDVINFSIPNTGPHTITPVTALPPITQPVIIDGYTQTAADENTNPVSSGLGSNAMLMIELDGSSLGSGVDGLRITGGGSTIKGLVINSFPGDGIEITVAGGNTIEGNFIGTNVAGTAKEGNNKGVRIETAGNTIGGATPAARNVISGNAEGVLLSGASAMGNDVKGNLIGTNAAGTAALGNTLNQSQGGIYISGRCQRRGSACHPRVG